MGACISNGRDIVTLNLDQKPFAVSSSTGWHGPTLLTHQSSRYGTKSGFAEPDKILVSPKIAAKHDFNRSLETDIDNILKEMIQYLDSERLQTHALRLLCDLVEQSTLLGQIAVVQAFSEWKSLKLITDTMTKHLGSVLIQQLGLRFLIALIQVKSSVGVCACAKNVGKSAVISNTVMAMREDGDDVAVQLLALELLFRLADSLAKTRFKIARSKGIFATVKVMATHLNDPAVQWKACCMLRALLPNSEVQMSMLEEGGAEAVVNAMQANPADVLVQRHGCWALAHFVYACEIGQRKVAELGGLEMIMKAMRAHAYDEQVQEHGCRAIRNLCSHNPELQEFAFHQGALEVLVETKRKWSSSRRVQEHCFQAISHLNDMHVQAINSKNSKLQRSATMLLLPN